MTVGFVALWKNNQREYAASAADEWGTTDRIQAAFANGRARGNRTYGLYFCRWSGPWQYFTFWVSPSMVAVFDTIADLEQAGDFKFADSEHLVGRFVEDDDYLTAGAWDVIPEAPEGQPAPLGVFIAERRVGTSGSSPRNEPARSTRELPALAAWLGIRMHGAFDCRFSTGWDRFTFWTAPHLAAVSEALARMERTGGTGHSDFHIVTGRLDHYFRFGTHLQTNLTWLNEEGPAG